jgi:hypothetical protein
VIGSLAGIQAALQGNLPVDVPVNFTTSGAFGNFGGVLAYAEPGSGAATVAGSLLLSGSGLPINSYTRAFGASSGAPLPGFPAKLQGLDFLGAPAIADVTGDGQPEVLVGGDSSALHAYAANTGDQAAGFPKFHTGWHVFGPAVGDFEGDGQNEVAIATREGYVMVWNTPGLASADQWWSYRHDERNTGLYGIDTRSPGVARNARIEQGQLRFKAPGDDWYAGEVDRYRVQLVRQNGDASSVNLDPSGKAGSVQKLDLPANVETVRVRAVDEAGNVGGWETVLR